MSEPHEVIVYSNPLEYHLWHTGVEGGYVFPIMCAAAVFMIAFMGLAKLWERRSRSYLSKQPIGWWFVVSSAAAALTVWGML